MCSDGLQHITTTIDSDLPHLTEYQQIASDEIVLTLHDEGNNGRLFKMPAW